jgi:hypothetical protein
MFFISLRVHDDTVVLWREFVRGLLRLLAGKALGKRLKTTSNPHIKDKRQTQQEADKHA